MSLSKLLSVRPPSQGTQSQSLAEGVGKELTCAICISRYAQPKILPCLHCYCKACLEDMVNKSRDKKNVTCPQCKVSHKLPSEGIDGFRTFFTINNLLELLHVHETSEGDVKEKVKCSSGLDEEDEANVAVARCLTCADYLCESCLKVHQKQKVTRNHVIKTLEEIKQSDKTTGAQSLCKKLYCQDHEEELLNFFCKTCKKPICCYCALVTHKEHDYTYIRDCRREIQKKLEGKVLQVQAKETEFKDHKKYVENLMKISQEAVDLSRMKVNKAIDEQIQALEARRAQLLAEVQTIHESEVKQISTESESLALSLLRLSDSVRFTRQLLDNGDDVEVAAVGGQTEETLTTLTHISWDKSTIKPSLLRPVFESMTGNIAKFGKVVHTLQKSDIVVSKLPARIVVGEKVEFQVHLSKEVSERGYNAKIEATTSCSNARVLPPATIKDRNLNSWTVSFTPNISGKHEVTVKVTSAPSVTHSVAIKVLDGKPISSVRVSPRPAHVPSGPSHSVPSGPLHVPSMPINVPSGRVHVPSRPERVPPRPVHALSWPVRVQSAPVHISSGPAYLSDRSPPDPAPRSWEGSVHLLGASDSLVQEHPISDVAHRERILSKCKALLK